MRGCGVGCVEFWYGCVGVGGSFVVGGGVCVGCVCVCIYIPPRSPEKIQFQTIDFLPQTCYNGNVKINGERRILG